MSEQEKGPDTINSASEYGDQEKRFLPGACIEARNITATNVVSGVQQIAEQHIHMHGVLGQDRTPPLQRPRRIEHFTDREAERSRLLADIQPGRVITVCGSGGMGKTALVTEVLWTLTPDDKPPATFPDGIIFHSFYEQPESTLALESIARSLGEEPLPTPTLAAQRVLSGRHILLVLDGAEEASNLDKILAICADNTVLVTSRRRADAADPAYRLDLQPLPREAAVTVVQSWGGKRAADVEATNEICERVGNLPLALRLVGRYLSQQEEEAKEYLSWLSRSPLAALDQGISKSESVPVLLERSITRLSSYAKQILNIVGILAMAPFDRELISQTLELSGEVVGQALGELVNYGLLLRLDQRYEVSHPLIHTYALDVLLEESALAQIRFLIGRLVHIMYNRFPKMDYKNWSQCEELLPHAKVSASWIDRYHLAIPEAAILIDRIGEFLRARAQYSQAEPLLEQALSLAEELYGPEDPYITRPLTELAILSERQGQYEVALSYAQRAQSIAEKANPRNDQLIGDILDIVAQLYMAQDQFLQAEELFKRALTFKSSGYQANHFSIAVTLNNLGRLYQVQGRNAPIEYLFQKALEIEERAFGPEHPETAIVFKNLAAYYQTEGQYEKAEFLFLRSLEIENKVLGPEHPDTANTLDNLAAFYQAIGRYDKVEPLYLEAMTIREKVLGPEHPDTVSTRNGLMEARKYLRTPILLARRHSAKLRLAFLLLVLSALLALMVDFVLLNIAFLHHHP